MQVYILAIYFGLDRSFLTPTSAKQALSEIGFRVAEDYPTCSADWGQRKAHSSSDNPPHIYPVFIFSARLHPGEQMCHPLAKIVVAWRPQIYNTSNSQSRCFMGSSLTLSPPSSSGRCTIAITLRPLSPFTLDTKR